MSRAIIAIGWIALSILPCRVTADEEVRFSLAEIASEMQMIRATFRWARANGFEAAFPLLATSTRRGVLSHAVVALSAERCTHIFGRGTYINDFWSPRRRIGTRLFATNLGHAPAALWTLERRGDDHGVVVFPAGSVELLSGFAERLGAIFQFRDEALSEDLEADRIAREQGFAAGFAQYPAIVAALRGPVTRLKVPALELAATLAGVDRTPPLGGRRVRLRAGGVVGAGTIVVEPDAVERFVATEDELRDVRASFDPADVPSFFAAANRLAIRRGHGGGLPAPREARATREESNSHEILAFRAGSTEWQDLPHWRVERTWRTYNRGVTQGIVGGRRFIETFDYAAGFTTFEVEHERYLFIGVFHAHAERSTADLAEWLLHLPERRDAADIVSFLMRVRDPDEPRGFDRHRVDVDVTLDAAGKFEGTLRVSSHDDVGFTGLAVIWFLAKDGSYVAHAYKHASVEARDVTTLDWRGELSSEEHARAWSYRIDRHDRSPSPAAFDRFLGETLADRKRAAEHIEQLVRAGVEVHVPLPPIDEGSSKVSSGTSRVHGRMHGDEAGTPFTDDSESPITRVAIHANTAIVRALVVTRANGETRVHGDASGEPTSVLELEPGEHLVRVEGHVELRKDEPLLSFLRIDSDRRPLFQRRAFGHCAIAGENRGHAFLVEAPEGTAITGFRGRAGDRLHALGVLVGEVAK